MSFIVTEQAGKIAKKLNLIMEKDALPASAALSVVAQIAALSESVRAELSGDVKNWYNEVVGDWDKYQQAARLEDARPGVSVSELVSTSAVASNPELPKPVNRDGQLITRLASMIRTEPPMQRRHLVDRIVEKLLKEDPTRNKVATKRTVQSYLTKASRSASAWRVGLLIGFDVENRVVIKCDPYTKEMVGMVNT